jgi:hypothetical protein
LAYYYTFIAVGVEEEGLGVGLAKINSKIIVSFICPILLVPKWVWNAGVHTLEVL